MNITLNTNNLTPLYRNNNVGTERNKQLGYSQPTFTSVNVPTDSKILNPIKRGFDNITNKIAEKYTAKVYTSSLARKMAEKAEDWGGVVNGMQITGSAIISGMYMIKTLTNNKLDEKRKQTLSINQGLTFGLSTACGLLIDKKLDNQWEIFTQKFTSRQINDSNLRTKIEQINNELKEEAETKYNKEFKRLPKDQKPKMTTAESYIETLLNIKKINKFENLEILRDLDLNDFDKNAKTIVDAMDIPEYLQKEDNLKIFKKILKIENINTIEDLTKVKGMTEISSDLSKNLKGMNLLKKIMVFGTVYRFLGPVAVTPLATWIGNNFLHKDSDDSSKKVA